VTSAAARTRGARARRRSKPGRRRRLFAIFAVMVLAAGAAVLLAAEARRAVNAVVLPLNHEDIIRQQARDKHLDPALIAGVIYAESHFREGRTSKAGAEGLMQITPATARDIARKSGGIAFEIKDLHTPQVNIAYGSFYLRYLLDRYGENTTLAVAAYNAGYGNVDQWVANSGSEGVNFTKGQIPFPETRAYVDKVLQARKDYRSSYGKQLGV
jgi:soluble lytic murein transglycosylase